MRKVSFDGVNYEDADRVPALLLPYQQRWVADQTQVKVCEKSRRVGISWASAAECALLAASSSGMDCWYVGYNREMAMEFIRDVGDWSRLYGEATAEVKEEVFKDEDKDILAFVVKFASGFRVTALSSRPTNLRGKAGYVLIDEAAFHDNLRELLKAALALLMWGGRVAIISTHDGAENPFNELVQEIRAGKRPYSLHRITLDDALSEGLYRRICLRAKKPWSAEAEGEWRESIFKQYGDAAEEELLCVPRNSGGAYLSLALIEQRVFPAPVVRLELDESFALKGEIERKQIIRDWSKEVLVPLLEALPPRLAHGLGGDFGRVSDLTVYAPVTREQTLVRRVPFMVELRNCPYSAQEQILFCLLERLPRFVGASLDATGAGSVLAEAARERFGSRIESVTFSESRYAELFPALKADLEDGLFLVPRDADVVDDLRTVQVINGVPKIPPVRKRGKDGKRRHADAAVAILLAHHASKMDAAEFGYMPVPLRPRDGADPYERPVRAARVGWRSRGGAF